MASKADKDAISRLHAKEDARRAAVRAANRVAIRTSLERAVSEVEAIEATDAVPVDQWTPGMALIWAMFRDREKVAAAAGATRHDATSSARASDRENGTAHYQVLGQYISEMKDALRTKRVRGFGTDIATELTGAIPPGIWEMLWLDQFTNTFRWSHGNQAPAFSDVVFPRRDIERLWPWPETSAAASPGEPGTANPTKEPSSGKTGSRRRGARKGQGARDDDKSIAQIVAAEAGGAERYAATSDVALGLSDGTAKSQSTHTRRLWRKVKDLPNPTDTK